MPGIIALYFLAGALFVGGTASGKYVYDAAQRESARDLLRRDRRALAKTLECEVELNDLRRRAEAAGVDSETVATGYAAIRDGRMSIDQVLASFELN